MNLRSDYVEAQRQERAHRIHKTSRSPKQGFWIRTAVLSPLLFLPSCSLFPFFFPSLQVSWALCFILSFSQFPLFFMYQQMISTITIPSTTTGNSKLAYLIFTSKIHKHLLRSTFEIDHNIFSGRRPLYSSNMVDYYLGQGRNLGMGSFGKMISTSWWLPSFSFQRPREDQVTR